VWKSLTFRNLWIRGKRYTITATHSSLMVRQEELQ